MNSTERLDAVRLRVPNAAGLEVDLFANADVPIDRQSVQEVLSFTRIVDTLRDLNRLRFFGDVEAVLRRIALMPDFHKGAGVAVGSVLDAHGFVLPRAPGSDIGCGVRLLVTDLTREEFERLDSADFERRLRHVFFEGGRDISLTPQQRTGLLRDGLPGLKSDATDGIWKWFDPAQHEASLSRCHAGGRWPTKSIFALDEYVQGSSDAATHDDVLGAVGAGNHFCEVSHVDEIVDRRLAYDWGLKKGNITIMAHSGSLSVGSLVGKHFMDVAKGLFPNALKHPEHGFYPLPTNGELAKHGDAYLSAMGNATNLAFVNRLFISLMTIRCLSEAAGREIGWRLVYDAPHNLIWSKGQDHLHRKGAGPAECDPSDEEFPSGHPVIVPGSMGAASYVLCGKGYEASFCSAPHGAGRMIARGNARRNAKDEIEALRIVGKIDFRKARRDVAAEYEKMMMEEAPSSYKPILPVIDTVCEAKIASSVARLWPLLTVKG